MSLEMVEEISIGKVIQRDLGPNGTVAGTSMIYEVELPNRYVKDYSANIISNNMLT